MVPANGMFTIMQYIRFHHGAVHRAANTRDVSKHNKALTTDYAGFTAQLRKLETENVSKVPQIHAFLQHSSRLQAVLAESHRADHARL